MGRREDECAGLASRGPTVWAALGEADGRGVEEHALRADVRGGAVPAVVRDRQLWTRKAAPGGGWKWRLSESEGRKTLSGTMHHRSLGESGCVRGADLPEVVGPDEELDGLSLGVHGHCPVEGLHMPLLHLTHL